MRLIVDIEKANTKKEKVALVLREFKQGNLKSGGSGKKVTNPKQAVAIAISEAEKLNKAKETDETQTEINEETKEYQDYTKNTVAFDVPYKTYSKANVKKVEEKLKEKWYRIERTKKISTDDGDMVLYERGDKIIAVWRVKAGDVFIVNMEI